MWDIDKTKLKTLRQQKKWSREEMARRANVSLYSIARLEGNSSRQVSVMAAGIDGVLHPSNWPHLLG